jgi:1-acyl-sn-glycerol-3-phosphate acyltransferase
MPELIKQIFWSSCYYCFLVMFFAGLWVINAVALVLPVFQGANAARRTLAKVINGMVALYINLMELSGALKTNRNIIRELAEAKGGLLVVANHPSMVDAPVLLSRFPGLVCVFKSALKQGLLLTHTARTAGYLSNDEGMDMLRKLVRKLRDGEKVLMFPEGTRTNGVNINPLNKGYAIAAIRAGIPVQLIRIHTDSAILTKRQHFIRSTRFPVTHRFDIGPTIEPGDFHTVHEMNSFVEGWFREHHNHPGSVARRYLPAKTQTVESDTLISATFRVPGDPFYCRGHMPGNPIVPAYVQMAWVHELIQSRFPRNIARIEYRRMKFLQTVLPGSVVEIKLQLQGMEGRVTIRQDSVENAKGQVSFELEGSAA